MRKHPVRTTPPVRAGNRRCDEQGVMVCLAVADGYVMARRPGMMPFVCPVSEWLVLAPEPPVQGPPAPVTVVWGGDQGQVLAWFADNGLRPTAPRFVPVWDVDSAQMARGLIHPVVVKVGTWDASRDRDEIEALVALPRPGSAG